MKKALFFCLSLVLLLSACTPSAGPTPSGPQLDPANPVTVTVWHYYNGKMQDAFNDLVADFNNTVGQETGIVVEGRGFGSVSDLETSVSDSVHKRAGAFDMPNIFAAYPDTAYAVDALGYVSDISSYLTAEEKAAYIDGFLEEGSLSQPGALKIFPIAKSTEVFMLNKTDWDAFAASTGASLDALATIEGVTATAKAYYEWTDSQTAAPNDGRAFFGRDNPANFMFIGARQLGTELFTVENGVATLHFDREIIRRLWDNSYVPYVLGYFSSSGRFRSDDIKIGNIIACVGSSAGASFYPDKVVLDDENTYPIELLALPAPQFEGGAAFAVQQGAGMVVTRSEDEAVVYASVQFLKWFTQPEQNIRFALASGYLPVTKEAADFDRIRDSVDDSAGGATLPVLEAAVNTIRNNTMSTPPAFAEGTAARNLLEYDLSDLAVADRAVVVEGLAAGLSLEEAAAEFLSDAYFDAWYSDMYARLEALAH